MTNTQMEADTQATPKTPNDRLKEIESEHVTLCTQAGYAQYQIEVLKAELHALNKKILALNHEAADLKETLEKSN